jgi:hypothetical protein
VNRTLSAFCPALLTLCLCTQTIGQSGHSTNVTVKEVRPVTTKSGSKLQQITVDLDFPGQSSIYIDGYGEIPSKANLTYLTDTSRLTIRAASGGVPLADQTLAATAVSMGGDLDQVPQSDFKFFGGTGPAPTTQHFRAAQADILFQKFLYPPYVYTHNSSTFSQTLYHRLTVDQPNLIVEVAAELSFPSDSTTNAGFELKYAVREKRKALDWQPEPSTTGAQAAKSFIVDLVQELTRSE